MEIYSSTTRFALACNNSTKIIEPIQSRCAVLRFTRLQDFEILMRLKQVAQEENVSYEESGLEAIIFTADGDMRNALNSMQSTVSGFGHVNADSVFKVCDQPSPMKIREVIGSCKLGKADVALRVIANLTDSGYAATDIIQTLFRVTRASDLLDEPLKLEFLREIGFSHMRIAEGLNTKLQLLGCVSRLSLLSSGTTVAAGGC